MAQISELMAAGMPAYQARKIGNDYNSAVVAAGSNQAGATPIPASAFVLATASGAGVLLPTAEGKSVYVGYNNSGATQTVYPTGSETINGGSSFSWSNGKSCSFTPIPLGWIANMSA